MALSPRRLSLLTLGSVLSIAPAISVHGFGNRDMVLTPPVSSLAAVSRRGDVTASGTKPLQTRSCGL